MTKNPTPMRGNQYFWRKVFSTSGTIGLPSGETEGGGGGDKSGLGIRSDFLTNIRYLLTPKIEERVEREEERDLELDELGLTRKRDVGS